MPAVVEKKTAAVEVKLVPPNEVRAAILAVERVVEWVKVPEWNGLEVGVQEMNGTELSQYEEFCERLPAGSSAGVRGKFLSMTLVDRSGARLFPFPADVAELEMRGGRVLRRLTLLAQKVNELGEEQMRRVYESFFGGQTGSGSGTNSPVASAAAPLPS